MFAKRAQRLRHAAHQPKTAVFQCGCCFLNAPRQYDENGLVCCNCYGI